VELDNPRISKSRQCRLLGISRSSLYYERKGFSEEDLKIMRAIDEQYLKTPFYGRRRMYQALKKTGVSNRPEEGWEAYASYGTCGHGSWATYQQEEKGAQGLSLPA